MKRRISFLFFSFFKNEIFSWKNFIHYYFARTEEPTVQLNHDYTYYHIVYTPTFIIVRRIV